MQHQPESAPPQPHHLVCQHDHSLDGELAVTEVEQVLQTGPKQVNDHGIVLALYAIPPQAGDAGCVCMCVRVCVCVDVDVCGMHPVLRAHEKVQSSKLERKLLPPP